MLSEWLREWIITESQNHRMVGVGRDLCGSSSPTSLPKQGHLQQAAQDLVQAGLEYLQRRRLHNLPGQPVPGLLHPQSEEVLPRVQAEIILSQYLAQICLPATENLLFLLKLSWEWINCYLFLLSGCFLLSVWTFPPKSSTTSHHPSTFANY